MEFNENTVNDVVEEVVPPQVTAEEGINTGSQSAKENARWAQLRRELNYHKERANSLSIKCDELERSLSEKDVSSNVDELKAKLAEYEEANMKRQFDRDMAEIKEVYPDETAEDVTALGEMFMALRANGVDNLIAYEVVRNKGKKAKSSPPPEIGKVGISGGGSEFFTSEELDKLTKKQLDNPKIYEKAMKSLRKLKK